MDPLDFTGRGVVVTGGTRGIGAAIASAFLAAGARVLVCGRGSYDGPAGFHRADVRDPEQAAALVAALDGPLDVLVNNAGGAPPIPAATASPRLHAKIIELNLIAPLHVAQAANAVMRAQPGGGVILMVGSVSGTRPSPGGAAYGAAKAGLHHLATSLAAEWAPAVRVNSVVPGPVAGLLDPEAVARTVPMGRPATPEDVAGVCLMLASPLASYVTGATVTVHGGGEWPGYLPPLR
ncbi:NAD(P)-dependent dehydrogenase (short-subunit alcohol dehydrogenase family) [Actinoplanes octamycinicus]|uniref:NAD(P)-dependent dehydrogenase (Short-subunit alcohol dehydrogenase family) n=1 Tax=Actinoplanes octamycinicus TaxID=135948 RepID=A0A7W7H751_9ACTN|nr:SDR family oxidoreductase [Actinoplanes octamycinicus]MBB4745179.1 NAD(P)-dependent dehydrogenase (short-subunit alcohol dehydrogenase family) [Actinoplanes octamycinicus]GIE62694.1 short chain dehydrogenase [Actinoplanes octamycinicus]